MSEFNRQAGIQEITQMMFDVNFAGSNSREEHFELQRNMEKILYSKKYNYNEIENYFISLGYQQPLIRTVFKELTGLDPLRENSADYISEVPGCLPSFNYAWGEGKGGKYKYVFIISYRDGFGIFGQINDIERDLIDYVLSLDEAYVIFNKNSKNGQSFRKVVDVDNKAVDKRKDLPYERVTEPIVQQMVWRGRSASLAKNIDTFGKDMQPREVRAMIRTAYDNDEITAQEHKQLLDYYMSRYAEEENKEMNDELTNTLQNMNMDSANIDTEKEAQKEANKEEAINDQFTAVSKGIDAISNYITQNLADSTENGKVVVDIKAVNYSKKGDDSGVIEATPDVEGQSPKQYFNKKGFFSVVINMSVPEKSQEVKKGILVFYINDKGQAESNGQFKGSDNELYPFNFSGISSYFDVTTNNKPQEVTVNNN